MDLAKIEEELKKRLEYPYKWGMRQNNFYNGLTNFIYRTNNFDDLLSEIKNRFQGKTDYTAFFNYAINRWFNFFSAQAVEHIFCNCEGIKPALDSKNRIIDFTINGIPFDHKTSVYPKAYNLNIIEAKKNPGDLIEWLYDNQSQQQRHHLKNRLFIILYKSDGEHWRLKCEISLLKEAILAYAKNFDKNNLLKFTFEQDTITLSDIIWIEK